MFKLFIQNMMKKRNLSQAKLNFEEGSKKLKFSTSLKNSKMDSEETKINSSYHFEFDVVKGLIEADFPAKFKNT